MRIYLCSARADEVSKGKFIFSISQGVKPSLIDIESVMIPHSWLLFDGEVFYFNEGGSTFTVTLNGNYDSEDFPDYFAGLLNASAGSETYTVEVVEETNLLQVSATGNFEIEWSKCSPRIRYILGGERTDTGVLTSWTGADSIDFGGDSVVFLESNIFGGGVYTNTQLSGIAVPVLCEPGSVSFYQPEGGQLLGRNEFVSHIEIQIRDIWGTLLDLRGKNLVIIGDLKSC